MDVVYFLAAPFLTCLALVGILGYFGLHVLLRRVIFVDLALAQIAALGTVVAFLVGFEPGSRETILFSLSATILGAAVFTLTRSRSERVPQEALIGITYVIASAAAILVADRAPEGAEHIKELLAGSILWVTWPTLLKDALVFAGVGVLHFALRKPLLRISEDPHGATSSGLNLRLWDFGFYVTFGVVITLAVSSAGVLMVFSYLVAPAIVALSSSDRWPARLLIAWATGAVASAAGLLASYRWDVPSGPAVVCVLGLLLLLFFFARRLFGGNSRQSAPETPRGEHGG